MCDSDNITGYTVVMFVYFTNNTTDATIREENIDPSAAHGFDPDIFASQALLRVSVFLFLFCFIC